MKTVNELLLSACKPGLTRADFDQLAKELVAAGLDDMSRTGLTDRIITAAMRKGDSVVAGVSGPETTGIARANDVACALHNALKRRNATPKDETFRFKEVVTAHGNAYRAQCVVAGQEFTLEMGLARDWLNIIDSQSRCETFTIDEDGDVVAKGGEYVTEAWNTDDWDRLKVAVDGEKPFAVRYEHSGGTGMDEYFLTEECAIRWAKDLLAGDKSVRASVWKGAELVCHVENE